MAVANYHNNEGHLPPAYGIEKDGKQPSSWRIALLPYIEQDAVHKSYRFNERWHGPNNSQLGGRMPKIYSLHGDYKPGVSVTNYLVIVGEQTAWPRNKRINWGDIKDGQSNTLGIVENRGLNIHWMEPRDLEFDTMDWTIDSPNGISSKYHLPGAVMLDGSVQSLSKAITPNALRALATIAGGEDLTGDFELWSEMYDGRDRLVTKP